MGKTVLLYASCPMNGAKPGGQQEKALKKKFEKT
jgi:hypothetical protein